jgi:hypothetical protein
VNNPASANETLSQALTRRLNRANRAVHGGHDGGWGGPPGD